MTQGTIAVIGTGSVGTALGQRLSAQGVPFVYGSRDPSTVERLPAPVVDVTTAIARSGIVLLAVPAPHAVDTIRRGGSHCDQIIVDCTNPLRWENGPIWEPPEEGSVSMELALAFPGAKVVKGFNHFGAEIQAQPLFDAGPGDAFFASDHQDAKAEVMELAARLGFNPVDAGGLRNAPLLENLAMLWIHLSSVGGQGRRFSFKMVRHV